MKYKLRNKYKSIFKWILLVLSIILLISYSFRVATIFDENYSLMLAHNSFSNIIKLDSLDVHPPLFYFLLKMFLTLTTFWTKSFLTKIIFARIFVIIISLITFIYLVKIAKVLNIYRNKIIEWLLFLIIPGVISFTYEFIKIRMYSLGALFVVIEFYELMRYNDSRNINKLILVIIMAILSFYTNYYAAFIAGILLLAYMIIYIFKHDKYWINIFISGLIIIVAFVPWMFVLIKQLSFKANHAQGGFLTQWIATVLLILVFVYPLIWSCNHLSSKITKYFMMSFIILICLFIFMTVVSLVGHRSVFEFRYCYPIYVIYGFIGLNVFYCMAKQNGKASILAKLLLIIITFGCIDAFYDQINYYNLSPSSAPIIKEFNYWDSKDVNDVHLKRFNNVDSGFDVEKAMYLSSIHKRFYAPKNINFIVKGLAYKHLFKSVNNHMINYNNMRK